MIAYTGNLKSLLIKDQQINFPRYSEDGSYSVVKSQ